MLQMKKGQVFPRNSNFGGIFVPILVIAWILVIIFGYPYSQKDERFQLYSEIP